MRWWCWLFAVTLASCAGEEVLPSATTSTLQAPGSPCDDWGAPVVTGRLAHPELSEVSGLVASRAHPGVLWVHNDSGGTPLLWALDPSGATRATLELAGAEAYDWEAASLGPGPGGDYLYVADTGDNLAARPYAVLYRVAEPGVIAGELQGQATALRVVYSDGPHDVEAMFVDPATGDAYLIAKVVLGSSPVFRVPAAAWGGAEATAEPVAALRLGLLPATAADLSPDGQALVVRTYGAVLLFLRPEGSALAAIFEAVPCRLPAPPEAQGEAIAWDGEALLTVGEGAGAALYRSSR